MGVKPYFETKLGKLYHGNNLDILPFLEESSVDMVLTDPPYGTNDGKGKVIRRGGTDTSFNVIDWDKELPVSYLPLLTPKMKQDTWGIIFTDNISITIIWDAIEATGLSPRNTFYWYKTNKAPTPRCNFKSCIETAVVFTKGRTNQRWYGGGNQSNMVAFPICAEGLHPTQKPIKLIMHLLEIFTKPQDTVLDLFFGSGTTGVACEALDRKWIAIERDEKYCEIASKRIWEYRREKLTYE